MREILFRGKRTDNGKWVEGFYWASLDPCSKETRWRGHFIHNGVNIAEPWKIHPETVGQYTGFNLRDKKIFEGDILVMEGVVDRGDGYKDDGLSQVVWNKENGAWELVGDFDEFLCEVGSDGDDIIGNIHDNPELIKQEEK